MLLVLLLCLPAAILLGGDQPGVAPTTSTSTSTATFAGGCFWGLEATFENIPGVVQTEVGFTGGATANPTYRRAHAEGHLEAVRLRYDPAQVSYQQLLEVYLRYANPATLALGDAEDAGDAADASVCQCTIFYHSPQQRRLAQEAKDQLEHAGPSPSPHRIALRIAPAAAFYAADEEHQHYYRKHGMTAASGRACRPATTPAPAAAAPAP